MPRILVAVLFGLSPMAAQAAPTGLNQIPITDLVPPGQLWLQLANLNTQIRGHDSLFNGPQLSPQSEFGLPWNMEAGLDVAPASGNVDYRPIVNLKWAPLHEDYYVPAAAVGVSMLGVGFAPNYYLVLSKTLDYAQIQYQKFRAHHRNIKLRGVRLHTGVQYDGYRWEALVGSDIEVSDHFIIYADWISGSQNSVSLGGVIVFDQHNSIQAALLRRNNEDNLTGLIIQIAHTLDFDDPRAW